MTLRILFTVGAALLVVSGCTSGPSDEESVTPSAFQESPAAATAVDTDEFQLRFTERLQAASAVPPGLAVEERTQLFDDGENVPISDWRTVFNPDGTVWAEYRTERNPVFSVVCAGPKECWTNTGAEQLWWRTNEKVLSRVTGLTPGNSFAYSLDAMNVSVDGDVFVGRDNGYTVSVTFGASSVSRVEWVDGGGRRVMSRAVVPPVPVVFPEEVNRRF